MSEVRPTAVAGQFYPNDAQQLQSWVSSWLQQEAESGASDQTSTATDLPRALIVPHAGYVYSGQAAATGFHYWLSPQAAEKIKTVVVIGPAHRVAFNGITTLSVDEVATPLGNLTIDHSLRDQLLAEFDYVKLSDFAQQSEHSIEVQLPFIKSLLPGVKVLPLLNGRVDPLQVKAVIAKLWQQQGVYFVISSDLSHFHPYEQAQQIDLQSAQMIEQFNWQGLSGERACGFKGIQGLLAFASDTNMKLERLKLINSGDTAGDKSRVVGYGTWALFEGEG